MGSDINVGRLSNKQPLQIGYAGTAVGNLGRFRTMHSKGPLMNRFPYQSENYAELTFGEGVLQENPMVNRLHNFGLQVNPKPCILPF